MKPQPFLFLFLMATLLACESKDNQILGNKVAGTWTVERVRFKNPYRPTTDSTARLTGASITFDACTFKGDAHTDCPGKYKLIGKQGTEFTYMVYGRNQDNIFVANFVLLDKSEFRIGGQYDTSFSDDNQRLELKGAMSWNDGSGKGNFSDPTAYLTLVKQP